MSVKLLFIPQNSPQLVEIGGGKRGDIFLMMKCLIPFPWPGAAEGSRETTAITDPLPTPAPRHALSPLSTFAV